MQSGIRYNLSKILINVYAGPRHAQKMAANRLFQRRRTKPGQRHHAAYPVGQQFMDQVKIEFSGITVVFTVEYLRYLSSDPRKLNGEVTYIVGRIEKEMQGTPATTPEHYYEQSPYFYNDTSQRAIKNLINTPIMLIPEPDIRWWLSQRGYDYSYINVFDQAAMINELQKMGNKKAIFVTTTDKGYRQPAHSRHSCSIQYIKR